MARQIVVTIKKGAMVGAGVALAVLLFAGVVQVTDTNEYAVVTVDPVSGLERYKPHGSIPLSTGCFDSRAVINNIGFHGPPVVVKKEKGVFRIVVIGSSYVESRQVQVAQMFSTALEKALRAQSDAYRYEVIPLGVNGNGSFKSLLYYHYYGSVLQPDLVISLESAFELFNHLHQPPVDARGRVVLGPQPQEEKTFIVRIAQESLRRSKFLVNLYSRFLLFTHSTQELFRTPLFFIPSSVAETPSQEILAQQEEERWRIKEQIMQALVARGAQDKAPVLFAIFTGREEATSTQEEITRHMGALAKSEAFLYHNITPFVRAREDETGRPATFLPCDGHWSPDGHQFVSEALLEYLSQHQALLRR